MIIKTSIGKGFAGCTNYLTGKENAEILHGEGVRTDSTKNMINDFCYQKSAHPEVSKGVWHASFSFNHADQASPELMKQIAEDYAKKVGFDQYAVIRHHDTKHEHFHVIGNRIKQDGTVISDQFSASRGVEFSKILEKRYELTKTQGKNLAQTNTAKLNSFEKTKHDIYKTVQNELKGCKNMEELKGKLKPHGIDLQTHSNSGGVFGVSFKQGNAAFKGSQLGKDFTAKALNKTFSAALKITPLAPPVVNVLKVAKSVGKGLSKGMEL